LELAIEEMFDNELNSVDWRNAFDSSDSADAIRTVVITGTYSTVVNAYVEMLRASASSRQFGLLPHRRPHAEQVFEAVRMDGGLTRGQVDLLNRLYVLEGRLEHASPDIDADEVREAIEVLRQELPALITNTVEWLRRHGVTFS